MLLVVGELAVEICCKKGDAVKTFSTSSLKKNVTVGEVCPRVQQSHRFNKPSDPTQEAGTFNDPAKPFTSG